MSVEVVNGIEWSGLSDDVEKLRAVVGNRLELVLQLQHWEGFVAVLLYDPDCGSHQGVIVKPGDWVVEEPLGYNERQKPLGEQQRVISVTRSWKLRG